VRVVVGSPSDLTLPLTESVQLDTRTSPLATLRLTVTKRTTYVSIDVATVRGLTKAVRLYLNSRSQILDEIAIPGKVDIAAYRLWEVKGGWGDEVD
jgi:hypothetical protein